MARRAGRPCAVVGCPEVVRDGRYCETHGAERAAQYDRRRGSSTARGYGYRWQKIRDNYLANHPLCVDPFGDHAADGVDAVAASDVDHIKPKRDGGTDDMDNLQSLCKRCHSKKTAIEDNRWGRGD